jgi:hypothetical protein
MLMLRRFMISTRRSLHERQTLVPEISEEKRDQALQMRRAYVCGEGEMKNQKLYNAENFEPPFRLDLEDCPCCASDRVTDWYEFSEHDMDYGAVTVVIECPDCDLTLRRGITHNGKKGKPVSQMKMDEAEEAWNMRAGIAREVRQRAKRAARGDDE